MGENSLETGYAIRCMEVVFLHGLMVGDTKASITMTKSRVMASSPGQMVESMMAHG